MFKDTPAEPRLTAVEVTVVGNGYKVSGVGRTWVAETPASLGLLLGRVLREPDRPAAAQPVVQGGGTQE